MMTARTTTMIKMITQAGIPPFSSTGATGAGASGVIAGTAIAGSSVGASAMVRAGGFVGVTSVIVDLVVDSCGQSRGWLRCEFNRWGCRRR